MMAVLAANRKRKGHGKLGIDTLIGNISSTLTPQQKPDGAAPPKSEQGNRLASGKLSARKSENTHIPTSNSRLKARWIYHLFLPADFVAAGIAGLVSMVSMLSRWLINQVRNQDSVTATSLHLPRSCLCVRHSAPPGHLWSYPGPTSTPIEAVSLIVFMHWDLLVPDVFDFCTNGILIRPLAADQCHRTNMHILDLQMPNFHLG